MLEYGEGYMKQNRLWLKRFRLYLAMHDNLPVYRLAQEMAKEMMEEEE